MLLRLNYPFRSAVAATASLLAATFTAPAQDNSAIAVAPQAVLPAQIAAPQSANWRNDIGTFKIGLVRGWSSDMSRPALSRVETLFSKALGTPVKVVVFERFTSLMDAQADGRIDMAAYSARAFATVRLMCECVDALASPATSSGQTGLIAVLAGDTARLKTLSSIGNSKIGRVATSNVASGNMLLGTLPINGKAVTGKEEFWEQFPDFPAAIAAYQAGDIDAYVVPVATTFAESANAEPLGTEQIFTGLLERPSAAIWRSQFWPYGPIAVRNNLAPEAKTILLQTLEQLDVSEPLAHATLSEGLPGAFQKSNLAGFANVSASIRLLVSQNANWR
jgi:phosphonate transport system substrate-binding protein